jgi:outer membrane lipoprotein carrier protein
MIRLAASFLFSLSVLLVPSAASAQAGPARAQLERFTSELNSLDARFEQRVINADGLVEDESSGRVWIAHPNRFRWEYGGDFPELVLADGERVWLYDEILEQVTIKPQSSLTADSPLMLLTDISQLDVQFVVRELGDGDGLELLELKAINPESQFERILLGLGNDQVMLMAMEDAFGLRTEIHFRDIKRNPQLDDELFHFTPPDGVDVIGDF